ncbi:hypothetical protein ABK040_014197 [Willaertia magna]
MGVLCLFIQEQREPKLNLFLHSHHEVSQNQAIIISDHFAKSISTNTSARGEVFILNKFRAIFILLNEVYVVTVCHKSDYPYDSLRCANNAKLILFEACKGEEVTIANLYKKFGQIMLALEELIHETNTFKPPSLSMEMVGKNKLGEANIVSNQFYNTTVVKESYMYNPNSPTINNNQMVETPRSSGRSRRGTIRQMEKLISTTADEMWRKSQQRMEEQQKRVNILERFKIPTDERLLKQMMMSQQGFEDEQQTVIENHLVLPDPSEIIPFQFGLDFTAPDEEDALPSFNHKRAKSTNTGSESNGISSFRKRQMEHIAMGQQQFLPTITDEEWHQLKSPSLPENLKPIIPSVGVLSNNNSLNGQVMNNNVFPKDALKIPSLKPELQNNTLNNRVSPFDRGEVKLISFEPLDLTNSSRMDEDTEVDSSEEDFTFRSDIKGTRRGSTTGIDDTSSIYDQTPSSTKSFNTQTTPPPFNVPPIDLGLNNIKTTPNQPPPISNNFLDDLFPPTTSTTNPMNNLPPTKVPKQDNNLLLEIDSLLGNAKPNNVTTNTTPISSLPPLPTTLTPTLQQPKQLTPTFPSVPTNNNIPPVVTNNLTPTIPPPINNVPIPPTNIIPPTSIHPTPSITPKENVTTPKEVITPTNLKPVQPMMPVFDPEELKKNIELSQKKRAAVIPFKVIVSETVSKNITGVTDEDYNFMGQIELQLFNHESYRVDDVFQFVLTLINDQFNNSENITKISKIVCNPKIAKQITSDDDVTKHNFECKITGQDINPKSNTAVLLKYKLKEHLYPVPLRLRPLFTLVTKDNQTMLTISIDYIVNPSTPVETLSFLLRPVPSNEEHLVSKSISKPEGRWNPNRQELLINVDNVGPKGTVNARFLLNRSISNISELQSEFLCKFTAKGTLSGFIVEGGDSKRSAHGQVFLGGCDYIISTPSWRVKLTNDNLQQSQQQ